MKLTLSLGQMDVKLGEPETNLARVSAWTAEAARRGSALVLFPELWSTGYDLENWQRHASPPGQGMFPRLAALAREHHIALGGSVLEVRDGKAYNAFALFDATGALNATYRKTHLFRLMDEEKWLAPGEKLELVEADWGLTGLGVCYDLRFPELFRHYALRGARLVLLPAEWPARRAYHWQTLLRARAIENQMFLAGCNRVGESKGEVFGGGSAVIDPWGEAVVEGGSSETLLTAEIDLDQVDSVRNRIPVFKDRRPEIYGLDGALEVDVRFSSLINAVDLHACGEPGRVITGGVLDVPGESMFAKMQYFQQHHDDLRLRMLREPRGYPATCCNLILPATRPEAQAGYIIMEQVEYPPMSGTNTICVATALLETGMLPMREPVTELVLEAPAGLIAVRADCQGGKVTQVTFRNVPAFAVHLDRPLEVPGLGTVTVDVAWGGMFYVIAEAVPFGLRLTPDEGRDITRISEMILLAAQEQLPVAHPDNPAVTGPTIAQLSGPPARPGADRRNAVTVTTGKLDWHRPASFTGAIDRSPCGTGTCAKMAALYAKGQLGLNQDFRHEGILGTLFTGRLVDEVLVGPYRAVVPTLSGTAWITGLAQYVVDPDDPFPNGFTVGDIWGA